MVPDEKKELEEPHNYFISELICLNYFMETEADVYPYVCGFETIH